MSITTLSRTRPSIPTHLISTASLSVEQVEELFDRAAWIAAQPAARVSDLLAGRILGVLFYQNSTRTRLSFEAAMQRLGGSVLGFHDVRTTRAGDFFQESLADTMTVTRQVHSPRSLPHDLNKDQEREPNLDPFGSPARPARVAEVTSHPGRSAWIKNTHQPVSCLAPRAASFS